MIQLHRRRYLILAIIGIIGISTVLYGLTHRIPDPPKLPQPALKDLAAKHNVQLGNFAISTLINEKPYKAILTEQFNVALLDNTPNWHFTDYDLRPSEKTYDFSRMDELVKYSEQHHMTMQAHHFLWGEEKWLPDWLKNGNYSREQLYKLIDDHIATVGGRYKGKIQEWTVVNEAFSRNRHLYGLNDWWTDHTGSTEYIDRAFIAARKADPKAKLILNDFLNESINDVSNDMYDYVKAAKARGVPIDAVGMQMHIDGTHPPTKDEVISNMKRFKELGVDVYVTEFDVNMNDLQAEPDGKNQVQANIYYEMMRACIESEACHSFSILGITDKETWYNHLGLPDSRPMPFDRRYQPKPAYWALRHALEQQ